MADLSDFNLLVPVVKRYGARMSLLNQPIDNAPEVQPSRVEKSDFFNGLVNVLLI